MALNRGTLEKTWGFKTKPGYIFTAPYTRHPSVTVETSPVLSGNTVYITASDGYIYALELESGRVLWSHNLGAPSFSTPAVSGNSIVTSDFGGNVWCFTI